MMPVPSSTSSPPFLSSTLCPTCRYDLSAFASSGVHTPPSHDSLITPLLPITCPECGNTTTLAACAEADRAHRLKWRVRSGLAMFATQIGLFVTASMPAGTHRSSVSPAVSVLYHGTIIAFLLAQCIAAFIFISFTTDRLKSRTAISLLLTLPVVIALQIVCIMIIFSIVGIISFIEQFTSS